MSEAKDVPDLNDKIAKHLYAKADEMEVQGKNKFRVIAFRKAARSVRTESRNLWGVYRSGGLKALEKIPGIGHRIAWEIVNQFKM